MTNARIEVGGADIIALVDAVPPPVEPSWSFPDVPPDSWSQHRAGSLDTSGRFRPNLGCFLVRTEGSSVLVDAGIGPGPNAYLAGSTGTLPRRLADEAVSLSEIDMVVFTHLHMDHVGWATDHDGRPTFPNASYVVAAEELAFWTGSPTGVGAHHLAAIAASIRPLAAGGRIRTIGKSGDIGSGLWFLATPGHTPGHRSVLVTSAGESTVIAGDVFHCPAQVTEPDWSHRADMDRETAARTRRRFIQEAAGEGWRVAAGHFRDGQTFGRIVGHDGSAGWAAASEDSGSS